MINPELSIPAAPNVETDPNWFKRESLKLLRTQIQKYTPDGYPAYEDRLSCPDPTVDPRLAITMPGPHWTEDPSGLIIPDNLEQKIAGDDLEVDYNGLPLHPWFDEMVRDTTIGVVAGRGFYYHYGYNHTADPVTFRYDLDEPYVHLIVRDTGQHALPGGFVDEGEDPAAAAFREHTEETRIKLDPNDKEKVMRTTKVCAGPLADYRATAHAGPYTHAYRIDLQPAYSSTLTTERRRGGDDAKWVDWIPVSEVNDRLFGSHRLIVQLALRK